MMMITRRADESNNVDSATKLTDRELQGCSRAELLCFAAQDGDLGEIERLLDLGTSVHAWAFDMPILAQTTSLPDATALLLSRGADPLCTLQWWIDTGNFLDATLVEYLIDDYTNDYEEVELYAATLTLLLEAGASHVVRNETVPDELCQILDRHACLRQLRAGTAPVIAAAPVARRL